ncbi:TLP-20 [Artaxa digramma nucleopolyhedrovirus]|uniref:TLP-20 n=1 Tax=Artaxa digramma nucleopolyhedrovirus TaxID=3070910 RepID=A0AAE6R757_9ABAC|nr:TLP-20 [Euproctis digramma nucleopolyhedrovirus]QHB21736.1 TLP-20 [Artaxa digramma nucleopolyhedrovirus]
MATSNSGTVDISVYATLDKRDNNQNVLSFIVQDEYHLKKLAVGAYTLNILDTQLLNKLIDRDCVTVSCGDFVICYNFTERQNCGLNVILFNTKPTILKKGICIFKMIYYDGDEKKINSSSSSSDKDDKTDGDDVSCKELNSKFLSNRQTCSRSQSGDISTTTTTQEQQQQPQQFHDLSIKPHQIQKNLNKNDAIDSKSNENLFRKTFCVNSAVDSQTTNESDVDASDEDDDDGTNSFEEDEENYEKNSNDSDGSSTAVKATAIKHEHFAADSAFANDRDRDHDDKLCPPIKKQKFDDGNHFK